MIAAANISPFCDLLLIGYVELLQRLFGQVVIPQAVHDKLSGEGTPAMARNRIAHLLSWFQIQTAMMKLETSLGRLHPGEHGVTELAD
jgi:predicted nucleic acid-binding protein